MTLALWTSEDAAAATRGTLTGPAWTALGISIDSRKVQQGDLFVAISGERFDGHTFVRQALDAGAAAALVSYRPADVSEDAPLLTVYDVLTGLEDLAKAARDRSDARIVALTGSVGKTGSKEMLGAALSAFGRVHFSEGNLNNHIGAPLSLARMPRDTQFGVFELGMNHAGEIAPLSRMVRPDVALITNVEPVHIGFFTGVEEIADAKAEIFEGLGKKGTAVLNQDNGSFKQLETRAGEAGVSDIRTFGQADGSDAGLIKTEIGLEGCRVSANFSGRPLSWTLGAVGDHWAFNSLGVLACIDALGLDLARASEAIGNIKAGRGRGETSTIALPNGGSFTLVDESYNASPPAVRAALDVLKIRTPEQGGRRIVVLGDMLELGDQSTPLHLGLKDALVDSGADLVFAVGPFMTGLHDSLPDDMQGGATATSDENADAVAASISGGDVVLIKGSLGMKMAAIVSAVRALGDGHKHAVNGH